ncbi:unnamed protein product [Cuscuta europaea]|uniref:Uncharacterized protein n=1 Tax=Cuscuta europaea TaxID=41803 RepID=A0A9P0YWE4_CUSEU|nr:unnamed protein product [Cuscuta europaea]
MRTAESRCRPANHPSSISNSASDCEPPAATESLLIFSLAATVAPRHILRHQFEFWPATSRSQQRSLSEERPDGKRDWQDQPQITPLHLLHPPRQKSAAKHYQL